MTSNRVEFVAVVHAVSKLGAAAVLLSPAWKAVEVDHALGLTGPATRSPTARPPRCSPNAWAAPPSPTSTTRRRPVAAAPVAATRGAARAARRSRRHRRRRSSCSARAPPGCPRRCATPTVDRPRHRPLVHGARPRPRRPLPGGHAPVAHPRPAQPAGRGRGRRHRPPAPPLRPRRGAAPHRVRPHHPRDGGRPHRPGDGQPPRPRGPRPLVAALHHVGRHPGDRERGRGGHRAHRGPVAAGLRRQRAAGDRLQPGRPTRPPGGSTPPACRPPASSCGWPTSTPARSSRPARPARSRPAARRSWPATCPTRPTPTPSPTAGTAPATSAGSSPRAGSTSPTAPRR